MKLLPIKIVEHIEEGRLGQIQYEIDDLCVERDSVQWEESEKLHTAQNDYADGVVDDYDLEEIERNGKIRVKLIQNKIDKLKADNGL